MPGWNPFKYDPAAGGLDASSRVSQGLRSNRVEHGAPADHVVRVAYHGTLEAEFSFVALLDPTKEEKSWVRNGRGDDGETSLSSAGVSVEIDVLTDPEDERHDEPEDGLDADVEQSAADAPVPSRSMRRSLRRLSSMRYTELALPRQWDHEHEVGPGHPVNRQPIEPVFHTPTFECRGGREHVVWIDVTLTPIWTEADPTKAWLEFVVTCKPV